MLSIIPYDTEEEAIEIANDTVYGLAGGSVGQRRTRAACRAEDPRRAGAREQGARRRAALPSAATSSQAIGREHGEHGLEEFLEVKALFE